MNRLKNEKKMERRWEKDETRKLQQQTVARCCGDCDVGKGQRGEKACRSIGLGSCPMISFILSFRSFFFLSILVCGNNRSDHRPTDPDRRVLFPIKRFVPLSSDSLLRTGLTGWCLSMDCVCVCLFLTLARPNKKRRKTDSDTTIKIHKKRRREEEQAREIPTGSFFSCAVVTMAKENENGVDWSIANPLLPLTLFPVLHSIDPAGAPFLLLIWFHKQEKKKEKLATGPRSQAHFILQHAQQQQPSTTIDWAKCRRRLLLASVVAMAGCGRNTSSSGRLLFSYFLTKWMMVGFTNFIYSLVPRLFSQLASTREKIGKESEKKK